MHFLVNHKTLDQRNSKPFVAIKATNMATAEELAVKALNAGSITDVTISVPHIHHILRVGEHELAVFDAGVDLTLDLLAYMLTRNAPMNSFIRA